MNHYPLLYTEEIFDMPVRDLAEDNSHLWLWCTNGTIREAYEVAKAWGFTVRSPLVWIKFRLGLGNYLRNSNEILLFCTRGRAPVQFRSQPTWFNAPVAEHSKKPDEAVAIIERVSPGPYLELFARRQPFSRSDWSIWGLEVPSDIEIPGYPVPNYSQRAPATTPARSHPDVQ
ncbi:MT-A70 family methyltransferase [Tsukamurella tyrosinosolvens]|uniref:MT-A70 family methyltransferase n=1 Tax=Tsukamurella tyrosinosolvens TaxID=57704 RepID=UPI002100606E|nr:MT-A70 family methyltransferase [Tsukamurella tyrosinosolvens]